MAAAALISIAPPGELLSHGPTLAHAGGRLRDSHGRAITDLRVSVTDRCNYRCVYCRTGDEDVSYPELPIADYVRMIRSFVAVGIEKVRLTGGEPLLRAGLVDLVSEISQMRRAYSDDDSGGGNEDVSGRRVEIALTTNGHLLEAMAAPLRAAGLDRVTVSMDAVDPETFARITRVPRSFERVLAGVRAARDAGLGPVKVNCVLLRGFNDDQIEQFAEFSRAENVIVRFIEWMPLGEEMPGGSTDTGPRTWSPDIVVPMEEILGRLNRWRPLVELRPSAASETARRFTFDDGVGEIGIIAPVSRPFCGHCSRVRLTSDGKIRTCLFSQMEHDLYRQIKINKSDSQIEAYIRHAVLQKEARHHIGEPGFLKPSRNMVHIGG